MLLAEITDAISLTACVVSAMFMAFHLRVFRYCISIPVMFGIAGAVHNTLGSCPISDIVYDMAIVWTITVLVVYSTKARKHCSKCTSINIKDNQWKN